MTKPGNAKRRKTPPRGERVAPMPDRGLRAWFARNWLAFRGVTVFIVLMALFYALVHTPATDGAAFEPYLTLIARVCGSVLSAVGQSVSVAGTSLTSSGFSVKVVRGCDGLEPIAAFVAAVLASPVLFRRKLPGILFGTLFLWLANIVRIVTLVLIGTYARSAFDIMHYDIWQAAFIVLAIASWAVWVQWATRPSQERAKDAR